MADLWFIKIDIAFWLKLTQNLTPTARAGLFDLCLAAWSEKGDATVPACSLVDDDERLARAAKLTPAEWRKVGSELRRLFVPVADAPGRLRAPWLLTLYEESQAAHAAAVERGKKGGRPKGGGKSKDAPKEKPDEKPNTNSNGNSKFPSKVNSDESSSDTQRGLHPGPNGPGGVTPRGDAPLAVAGGPGAPPRDDEGAAGAAPTGGDTATVRAPEPGDEWRDVMAQLRPAPRLADAPLPEVPDDVAAKREQRRAELQQQAGPAGGAAVRPPQRDGAPPRDAVRQIPGVRLLLRAHFGARDGEPLPDPAKAALQVLRAALADGAFLDADTLVRAADAAHLSDVCREVASVAVDGADAALRCVLELLRDTAAEARALLAERTADAELLVRQRWLAAANAWLDEHPQERAAVLAAVEAQIPAAAADAHRGTDVRRQLLLEDLMIAAWHRAMGEQQPAAAA